MEIFKRALLWVSQDAKWTANEVAKKASEEIQNICDLAKQLKAMSCGVWISHVRVQAGSFYLCVLCQARYGNDNMIVMIVMQ